MRVKKSLNGKDKNIAFTGLLLKIIGKTIAKGTKAISCLTTPKAIAYFSLSVTWNKEISVYTIPSIKKREKQIFKTTDAAVIISILSLNILTA